MTGRAGRSHAIADGVTGGRDVAFRADVAMAVELVMAHVVEMETGSPVAYMGVWERFIVLGQGKVWRVRGAGFIGDVEVGREHGAFISKVIEEGIDLGYSGSQAKLGISSKEDTVEADITTLEKGKESANFLVRRDIFNKGDEGISHGHVIVTIEDPPVPFSPFSLTNCTMLNHFSFNDFIAIAFPDIAGDLDIPI